MPSIPFVSGTSRSGTTLLRLMLDSHSQLAFPPEIHFLHQVFSLNASEPGWLNRFEQMFTSDIRWSDFQVDSTRFHEELCSANPASIGEALRVFFRLSTERFGKPAWGDKSPQTLSVMGAIARELPEACFIHIIRDGRDVAVSLKGRWWTGDASYAELITTWAADIQAARDEAARSKCRYLEVHYEQLVAAPEPTLRTICDFIGYPFEPAMLEYAVRAHARHEELQDVRLGPDRLLTREERIAKHQMTLQAPTTERIGRWKTAMSAAEVQACELVAGAMLEALGYKEPAQQTNLISRVFQMFSKPL